VKPIHFASDAAGFGRFQRNLDRHSPDPRDFLILLEPTGSYGLTVLLYLLGKGYRVLQIENRAVKDDLAKLQKEITRRRNQLRWPRSRFRS
jgi:transposase